MPLLAFTEELQKLVPVALAILYVIGHIAGLFGKKKESTGEPEVDVELEDEPTPHQARPAPPPHRPPTAPPAAPPVAARLPTRPEPQRATRFDPLTVPDGPPRQITHQPRPVAPPPRRPIRADEWRRRREPAAPPASATSAPVEAAPVEARSAYAISPVRAGQPGGRADRIQFGKPTPDPTRQAGQAARDRILALLRDRQNLRAAVLLSEILDKPLSERDPRY